MREFYQNTRDMHVFFMKYEDMHADGVSGTGYLKVILSVGEEGVVYLMICLTFKFTPPRNKPMNIEYDNCSILL